MEFILRELRKIFPGFCTNSHISLNIKFILMKKKKVPKQNALLPSSYF